MTAITVETIVGYIGQFSWPDRASLYRILATEAMKSVGANGAASGQEKLKPLPIPTPDPEPSRRWIAAHRAEYAGQ
jgi:hypothetical protein